MKTQLLSASFSVLLLLTGALGADVPPSLHLHLEKVKEYTGKPIQNKGIFRRLGGNQYVRGGDGWDADTDIKESRRNLDGQDDYQYSGGGEESYSYYDDAREDDNLQDGSDTVNNSKIQKYEAQAVHLYETAPAEWNSGQWIAFTLLGTLLMFCCVMLSFYAQGCCADDDDDYSSCRNNRCQKSYKSRLLPSDSSDSDASSSRRWFSFRRSRRR